MYTVLNRSKQAPKYVAVESKAKLPTQIIVATVPPTVAPKAIIIEVDKNTETSRVKVKTKNSPMTEVVYEFQTTETNLLIAKISKTLNMSHEDIINLIQN
jgi:hypothetical protein